MTRAGASAKNSMKLDAAALQAVVDDVVARCGVPGATIHVRLGDEGVSLVAGVANLETGIPMTPDTRFLIGSISKVYTTCVVLRLVDVGKLDLDTKVVDYLPQLHFAEAGHAEELTLRHLLTHTDGVDGGDYFPDLGPGDDAIARYVDNCRSLARLAPTGTLISYSNMTFTIAGRIVEVVTGATFEEAQRQWLLEPMGLRDTVQGAEEAIRGRVAIGHVPDAEGGLAPAPIWIYPRANAPAGTVLCATAGDLANFGAAFVPPLSDILSSTLVEAMQIRQFPQAVGDPYAPFGDDIGLGWWLLDWDGIRVLAHDGSSPGGSASLRVVPERQLVVSGYTNATTNSAADFYGELHDALFPLLGIRPPSLPSPVSLAPDQLEDVAGRYERLGQAITVEVRGDDIVASQEFTGNLAEVFGPMKASYPMRPAAADLFLINPPLSGRRPVTAHFIDLAGDGRPTYLHTGIRAARRVA